MSQYLDTQLSDALRRAKKIVDSVMGPDVNPNTRGIMAASLAPAILEIDLSILENKEAKQCNCGDENCGTDCPNCE